MAGFSFKLVLASSSPRRAELLQKARIDFEIAVPAVEEGTGESHPHLSPTEIALSNAHAKARAIAPRFPERWVLGADTIVVKDGRILGKPADMEEARRIFDFLNGAKHRVITAVFLIRVSPFHQVPFYDMSEVEFHRLSPQQRDAYLAEINPLDKAGAYAVQSKTETVIKEIRGSVSNVMGLPMEKLEEALHRVERHSTIGMKVRPRDEDPSRPRR